MRKTVPWIIPLALCLVLAGCSPQAPEGAALEGVLLKLGSYTEGENDWALVRPEGEGDVVTLFSLPEEATVQGGPLEEGQSVEVICQSVRAISPAMMENVSYVEVVGDASAQELKEARQAVQDFLDSLSPPSM